VAALDPGPEGIEVRGAFPHLRLWPDAAPAGAGSAAHLPRLTPNWEKRLLDLSAAEGAFEPGPLPLGAVYLLAPRQEAAAPRLEAVSPSEALLALIANTYAAWVPDAGTQGADLALFGRLAREVPVLRAVPHLRPERLDQLCTLIERDAALRLHG
jgi:hypothetical protein